ncbi:MAG: nitrile hydratase subunit alpha [Methylobacterium sp.]|nr:MAG: nitrile hydratase subunit alpha [Methylobacterium sp.]
MTMRGSRFVSHPADEQPVIEGHEGAEYYDLMTAATRELLIERGFLEQAEIDAVVAKLEAPRAEWGALIVARAWLDIAFKTRLLADGVAAAAELGFSIKEAQLVVVENTANLHNLIVCTLCSCYPRSLLGQPPWWYISKTYRARAVREPRQVLKELGLEIPPDVELRVHDSNADMRYLVLPMRPDGTDELDEAALAALVTRDAMIGAALAGRESRQALGGDASGS